MERVQKREKKIASDEGRGSNFSVNSKRETYRPAAIEFRYGIPICWH